MNLILHSLDSNYLIYSENLAVDLCWAETSWILYVLRQPLASIFRIWWYQIRWRVRGFLIVKGESEFFWLFLAVTRRRRFYILIQHQPPPSNISHSICWTWLTLIQISVKGLVLRWSAASGRFPDNGMCFSIAPLPSSCPWWLIIKTSICHNHGVNASCWLLSRLRRSYQLFIISFLFKQPLTFSLGHSLSLSRSRPHYWTRICQANRTWKLLIYPPSPTDVYDDQNTTVCINNKECWKSRLWCMLHSSDTSPLHLIFKFFWTQLTYLDIWLNFD